MALRRTAAMLLNRTVAASKAAAPRSALHTSSALLGARQPQQLTMLTRFLAAPAAAQSARLGSVSVRSHASDAYASPPLGLKDALKSELEYEHDNYEPDADLPAQPPAPWTLTESPGDSRLTLTRQHGDETIEVRVMADECHEDDDEEHPLSGMAPETGDHAQDAELDQALDDSIDVAIVAQARVTKGGRSIDISFRTDGEYVQVIDVSLGEPDVKDDDESAYAGPKYEELDDQVQTAFDAYVEQRGVDAAFGEYLMKLAADKEQREYVGWLQKVHDFM